MSKINDKNKDKIYQILTSMFYKTMGVSLTADQMVRLEKDVEKLVTVIESVAERKAIEKCKKISDASSKSFKEIFKYLENMKDDGK